MVLVHDTLSECTLQKYEVSSDISCGFQVIEGTQFCDRQADGQTDGQMDGRMGKNNMSPDPSRMET